MHNFKINYVRTTRSFCLTRFFSALLNDTPIRDVICNISDMDMRDDLHSSTFYV
jgi:hypothetical protein